MQKEIHIEINEKKIIADKIQSHAKICVTEI